MVILSDPRGGVFLLTAEISFKFKFFYLQSSARGAINQFFILFEPCWKFYARNFPDVIMTRFVLVAVVYVKNSAIREVQMSDNCLSRPAGSFINTIAYVSTGKPLWTLFDGNAEGCDWRGARKTNLVALNALPKPSQALVQPNVWSSPNSEARPNTR